MVASNSHLNSLNNWIHLWVARIMSGVVIWQQHEYLGISPYGYIAMVLYYSFKRRLLGNKSILFHISYKPAEAESGSESIPSSLSQCLDILFLKAKAKHWKSFARCLLVPSCYSFIVMKLAFHRSLQLVHLWVWSCILFRSCCIYSSCNMPH